MLNSTGLKSELFITMVFLCLMSPGLISLMRNVGQHYDSRMNIALIMSAVKHNAIVANHCEITKLNNSKINRARVKDNLTGEEWNMVGLLPPFLHPLSELFRDLYPGDH